MPNAPRVRAEQKDIAGQALDREILIDRADYFAFGLDDHGVCRAVRNRAAGVIAASFAPRRPRSRWFT